jgi:hypothetical protein
MWKIARSQFHRSEKDTRGKTIVPVKNGEERKPVQPSEKGAIQSQFPVAKNVAEGAFPQEAAGSEKLAG